MGVLNHHFMNTKNLYPIIGAKNSFYLPAMGATFFLKYFKKYFFFSNFDFDQSGQRY